MNDINIALNVLNRALATDSEVVENLITRNRAFCKENFANDPSIPVLATEFPGHYTVSSLGLINGILFEMTGQKIAAVYEMGDNGQDKLIHFEVYNEEAESIRT